MTGLPSHSTRGVPSPLVEAVTKYPGEWTVESGDGATNPTDREMFVPLDNLPCRECGKAHSPGIRGHELMHSKISPLDKRPITVKVGRKVLEVSSANVEVAEEYRVNYSLSMVEGTEYVYDMICDHITQRAVELHMDQGKYQDLIRYAMAGGPGFPERVADALYEYEASLRELDDTKPEMAKYVTDKTKVALAIADALPTFGAVAYRIMSVRQTMRRLPPWTATEKLAAYLEANLKDFDRELAAMMVKDEPDLAVLAPSRPLASTRAPSGEGGAYKSGKGASSDKPKWGKNYLITTAKMPLSLAPWKLQRINRAVDEGTIPRYMHRWPMDKRVFHRTKRLPGGSILVDDSGSMGLSSEELDQIVESAPASTVAIYAGRDDGDGGEIRVVAMNGKRAEAHLLKIGMNGNGIDGPALEWLGSQPYPRVWISDGMVTGGPGSNYTVNRADAYRLCVENRITRVRYVEEAVTALKRGKFAR